MLTLASLLGSVLSLLRYPIQYRTRSDDELQRAP
jgi:hypothetical protein